MLNVLHFYKTYYPDSYGGIEQVIFQLSEGAAAQGISSTVLSLSERGNLNRESLGQHYVACSAVNFECASTPFSIQAIDKFRKLAAQADVIHYHFPFPFMDMVHFIADVKKPTLVTYHSDIVKQKWILKIYRPLMNRFLASVDSIVASSPNYVATSPVLQNYLTKISVIPFGLDRTSYPASSLARLAQWRQSLGEKFFLFIGAFRYYKGLHTLMSAAAITGYPIVLVGEGPIQDTLKKQVSVSGLSNVHFLGALQDEDKRALLELCCCVVFPSHLRSEAFGITLLEGAMYGKPLITCEIGTGTTYININEQTGLVVPPDNPAELAVAMHQIWQHPQQAAQFGKHAEERFNHLFTSERMVADYVNLYHRLTEHREQSIINE